MDRYRLVVQPLPGSSDELFLIVDQDATPYAKVIAVCESAADAGPILTALN